MRQDVTRVLVFDSKSAPRSLVDLLEIEGTVSAAAQHYRTHWQGGAYRHGFNAEYAVAIQAGYTLADGSAFFPFGYSWL